MAKRSYSDLSGDEKDAGWRILGGYARVREEPEDEPSVIGGTWGSHQPNPEPNGLQGLVNKGLADRDSHAPDVWDYALTEDGRVLFEGQAAKNQKKNKKT